jgi:hypothetical protein
MKFKTIGMLIRILIASKMFDYVYAQLTILYNLNLSTVYSNVFAPPAYKTSIISY